MAHQLPLITASIIVLVMALSLTLTYRALVESRSDALHSRTSGLLRVLVQSGEHSTKARVAALRQFATDSTLVRALAAPSGARTAGGDASVAAALGRLAIPADSGLPIELWTVDGRRVAHVGQDVRDDSIAALVPELRSRLGTRVSEVTGGSETDSAVQIGALYPSAGRVFYWTVAPVMRDGRRLGAIVQQRRIVSNPQARQMVRDLSGEEFTVYLRNATDGFWSSVDGRPAALPAQRDTTDSGYVARRAGSEPQVGAERRVRGTPFIFVLEAPKRAIVAEPRRTLRHLALVSVLLLIGGIAATWGLSRQITRPLVELAAATEAMAQGQYGRRVENSATAPDEVRRLAASFNRMTNTVEASQRELAAQVDRAIATSEQLELVNQRLQQTSAAADEARDAALDANRAKSDFLAVMSHLAASLGAIEDFVGPQLRDRTMTYTLHPVDAGLTVRADADKLQQILVNLLSNSVKYTPEGGHIDVRCEVEGDQVRVHVQDTGIGIAADRIERIFDPFIQIGRALNRPHEGVGLGLAISRDLATAMGGTLSVASTLGTGSVFTLMLRRGAPAAPAT